MLATLLSNTILLMALAKLERTSIFYWSQKWKCVWYLVNRRMDCIKLKKLCFEIWKLSSMYVLRQMPEQFNSIFCFELINHCSPLHFFNLLFIIKLHTWRRNIFLAIFFNGAIDNFLFRRSRWSCNLRDILLLWRFNWFTLLCVSRNSTSYRSWKLGIV